MVDDLLIGRSESETHRMRIYRFLHNKEVSVQKKKAKKKICSRAESLFISVVARRSVIMSEMKEGGLY